jgi:hypothetical protein
MNSCYRLVTRAQRVFDFQDSYYRFVNRNHTQFQASTNLVTVRITGALWD